MTDTRREARRLTKKERLALAHHEAGHAVVQHCMGLPPFEYVEMISDAKPGQVAGRVHNGPRHTSSFQEICFLMGGPAAEAKHRGWDADKILFENLCRSGPRSDYSCAVDIAKEQASKEQAQGVVYRFYEITRGMIDANWTAIQQVAQALLKRHRLTWDEFLAIVQPLTMGLDHKK